MERTPRAFSRGGRTNFPCIDDVWGSPLAEGSGYDLSADRDWSIGELAELAQNRDFGAESPLQQRHSPVQQLAPEQVLRALQGPVLRYARASSIGMSEEQEKSELAVDPDCCTTPPSLKSQPETRQLFRGRLQAEQSNAMTPKAGEMQRAEQLNITDVSPIAFGHSVSPSYGRSVSPSTSPGPFRSPPQSPYAFMLPSIAEQHSHSESPHSHQSPPPPALSFLGQMAMGDMAIGDSAVGDMMPENTAAAHNDVNRGEDVQSGIESFGRSSTSEAGRGGSGDLPRLRKRSAISRLYSSRSPSHIADFQRQRASSHHTASRSYSPRSVASAVLPPSVFPMQVMGGGPIGKTSFSEALFGGGLSPVVGGMSGRNTNAFWQSPGLSGTSFGQGSRSAAHVNMSKKSASASFNAAMFSPSMNSPGFEHSVAQTGGEQLQ